MARLGLFLIGVVAWASEQLSRNLERPVHYALAGTAYAALAGVTTIGLAVDGLFSMQTVLRGRTIAPVGNGDRRPITVGRGSPVV